MLEVMLETGDNPNIRLQNKLPLDALKSITCIAVLLQSWLYTYVQTPPPLLALIGHPGHAATAQLGSTQPRPSLAPRCSASTKIGWSWQHRIGLGTWLS